MGEKTPHPTQKPEELLRKLVLASSNPGDLVADPFSGSGTTITVAEQLGRRWVGCDCNLEYNNWAIKRVSSVIPRSVSEWIHIDAETTKRRESIR
jgi:site-specific DNA-methyltransferase (adenine-specific)